MSLERKTLAIMAATLAVAFVISYATGQFVLRRGFAQVEENDARAHLARARAVLADKVDDVDHVLSDWAAWDDSYQFVEDRNPEYAKSNLVVESFLNIGLHVCVFINTRGEVVWARRANFKNEELTEVPGALLAQITSTSSLSRPQSPDDIKKGILLTEKGPLLIASRPIIHSDKTGPVRGALIMGRFLDEERIEAMSRVLLERPTIHWVGEPGLSPAVQADLRRLRSQPDALIEWDREEKLSCTTLVKDIYDHDALILQLSIPREIYHQGQDTVRALLVAMCAGSCAFTLLTLRLLKRQVLHRIIQLDRTAQSIAQNKDVSQRVQPSGRDELSSLARSFNSMLAELEVTQADLRKAKDVAEEANQTKSRFLANVSHEIRTPLNCIIGYAEMMGSSEQGPVRERAETILREAEILLALINDLLDNAKIEAGRLELERRPFDLHELLRGAARVGEVQGEPKGLQINLSLPAELPRWIEGDSLRFRQILLNLVTNAVKFTDEGSVTIGAEMVDSTSPASPVVRFSVTDTGIGIPQDRQEAIFQSFAQVDASTTRRHGGTGLGTTIARQLTELMGGTMGLSSVPGRGSTFWFTLPLRVCGEPQADAQPDGEHEGPHRRGNILFAEDYRPSREMGTLMLEEAGHTVTAVENGRELVEAAARDHYDLIITDIQMPVMDGYQAIAAIRASEPYPDVPIIALTAESELGARERCRELGVNEVMIKPVRRAKLFPAVDRWLAADPGKQTADPERVSQAAPAEADNDGECDPPMDYETAVAEFGSRQVVDEVAAHFMTDLESQLELMRTALAGRDTETLRRQSHAIKGGAGTLTAMALANSARNLEQFSAAGADGSKLESAFQEVIAEFDRLKQWVSADRDAEVSDREDE